MWELTQCIVFFYTISSDGLLMFINKHRQYIVGDFTEEISHHFFGFKKLYENK